MIIHKFIAIIILIVFLIIGLGQGCSKLDLEIRQNVELFSLQPNAELCVPPPKEIGKYSKILFIVDVSGSNRTSATDPNKVRRLQAMETFFNEHRSNTYIEWGLAVFGGNVPGGARHLINKTSSGLVRNFGNSLDFEAALNEFRNEPDDNATPYVAALNRARNALDVELEFARLTNDEVSSFHFIFISDGVPAPANQNTDEEIYSILNTMMSNSEGKLKFSTVFYNVSGSDTAAISRLQEMARVGNGRFQDASNGEQINIRDLIVSGISYEPYYIKDFFVYNLNSTICEDGRMGPDSDSDGICDRDELHYNQKFASKIDANPIYRGLRFNPQSRNSFNHGYADLFMYKTIIEGEALPSCDLNFENLGDEDDDLLNRCEEMFLISRNPQGPTLGWTQEMIRDGGRASHLNFDSDGDGLLDSLEFFFFKHRGFPLNYNTINERFNRRSFYDYFVQHQSYQIPESSPPYNLNVKWVRRNEFGLNCYHVEQEQLPIYPVTDYSQDGEITNSPLPRLPFSPPASTKLDHSENENVILIYYLVTTQSDPDGKGLMRYSYQRRSLKAPNQKINFNELPFKEIKAR